MKETILKIVEGVAGLWHYHLSETGLNGKPALCGNKDVMTTAIPLKAWDNTWPVSSPGSYIRSSYCETCGKIYKGLLPWPGRSMQDPTRSPVTLQEPRRQATPFTKNHAQKIGGYPTGSARTA